MLKLLQLRFLPTSVDFSLLVLRIWYAVPLLTLHGWDKLIGYAERSSRFADPFGIGAPASLALSIFAEVFCSMLLVFGLCTRFAALVCAINMGTAFWFAHGLRLTGERNGEMAFAYLGAFVVILLAGPGRFSVDARLGGKR